MADRSIDTDVVSAVRTPPTVRRLLPTLGG